jgi:hypothetical protein
MSPACDAGALRSLAGAAREAAIQRCELVLAVERRSALDRLISGIGVRGFVPVVAEDDEAITAAPGSRDVFIGV